MKPTSRNYFSSSAPEPKIAGDGELAALGPWFHNLHLPDGRKTFPDHPYGDFPAFKWRQIAPHLPEDLHGWNALDIGCNAGFYSLELARRGARVLAIDSDSHYLQQARWAAPRFGLQDRIDFQQMQVYSLARVERTFDLILFMGVFYHLRYPQLALDLVAGKVGRLLVFQTMIMPGEEIFDPAPDSLGVSRNLDLLREPGWPKMAFIEHSIDKDPTNWWIPNHAGVAAMLRSSGLRVITRPGHEIYLCEPDRENPACVTTWDKEEYHTALGLP